MPAPESERRADRTGLAPPSPGAGRAPHVFHLRSEWRLPAGIEAVAALLAAPERFPLWWPEVYLEVEELDPGGLHGVGRRLRLLTRGFLPYRLRWIATLLENDRPRGWTIAAEGDLVGRGVWRLTDAGAETVARYDWRVAAAKPALRRLSPVLAPLFAWNHTWAMARGREGALRELARRDGT